MADKKISQLTALAAANLAPSTDVLAIVDTSATETKKIVAQDLINGVLNVASAVGIGTASPAHKLDVRGSTDTSYFNITSTADANSTTLRIGTDATAAFINATGSSSGTLQLRTYGTTRATLDSSGNLGLGVTPSAWISGALSLDVRSTSSFADVGGSTTVANNCYRNSSGNWIYKTTNFASRYETDTGQYRWLVAPSGTAGNTISFTTAMALDSSGSLGIGTTSPSGRLHISTASGNTDFYNNVTGAGTAARTVYTRGGTVQFYAGLGAWSGTDTYQIAGASGPLTTLNTSGNLGIGTASPGGKLDVVAAASQNAVNITLPTFDYFGATIHNQGTSGDNKFVAFATEAAFTTRGSIDYNRAGGLTAYNTTSDYRAKDILGSVQNSGATIDALKVYRGKMHGATMERPMLIAHEAQEVAPYAVTGEKDAVNDDGDPVYQQMDTSSLVPLLIAEIQSLRSRVAALEAK